MNTLPFIEQLLSAMWLKVFPLPFFRGGYKVVLFSRKEKFHPLSIAQQFFCNFLSHLDKRGEAPKMRVIASCSILALHLSHFQTFFEAFRAGSSEGMVKIFLATSVIENCFSNSSVTHCFNHSSHTYASTTGKYS